MLAFADQYINNDGAMNHLKRGNSSIDGSPAKQPRYEKVCWCNHKPLMYHYMCASNGNAI